MGDFKPVVLGIPFRRTSSGYEIFTQLRLVQNAAYDPLYDQTWEAVGETVKPEDCHVLDTLVRGIREECGDPEFEPVALYGACMRRLEYCVTETGKADPTLTLEPFALVQQLGPPQPWIGPVFVVEVASTWEPDPGKKDGEAGDHRWWNPSDLKRAIEKTPGAFMGLHMMAILLLCGYLGGER